MLNGFKALISQYKNKNTTFPNTFGLYSYRDYSEDRRHRNNSYCVIRDENKIIAAYSLPPIFAQNRFFNSSTYVLIPDFTYFSTFHNFHNHGDPKQDIWFHEIENSKEHFKAFENLFSAEGSATADIDHDIHQQASVLKQLLSGKR
jgi:hypothetical protein